MSGKRISDMSNDEVFAATVYMETRRLDREGQTWVAWVIKNRKNNPSRFGHGTYRGVCLAPSQFECWTSGYSECLSGDKFRVKSGEEDIFELSQRVVRDVHASNNDPTSGADHYHAVNAPHSWAADSSRMRETGRVGGHIFYREIR